tara:strand:+ start:1097 stop:1213 length:117 start_codon:yes stop_codon:yes gene_type:complete
MIHFEDKEHERIKKIKGKNTWKDLIILGEKSKKENDKK